MDEQNKYNHLTTIYTTKVQINYVAIDFDINDQSQAMRLENSREGQHKIMRPARRTLVSS